MKVYFIQTAHTEEKRRSLKVALWSGPFGTHVAKRGRKVSFLLLRVAGFPEGSRALVPRQLLGARPGDEVSCFWVPVVRFWFEGVGCYWVPHRRDNRPLFNYTLQFLRTIIWSRGFVQTWKLGTKPRIQVIVRGNWRVIRKWTIAQIDTLRRRNF